VVVFLLWFLGNGWNESSGDDTVETALDPKENLINAAIALSWTLRLFPSFCLGNGLFNAVNLGDGTQFFKGGEVTSVWDDRVLLYEAIFLVLDSILYLFLAIQLDEYSSCPEAGVAYSKDEDDDVLKEQSRVEGGGANSDLIVMKNLSKRYNNGMLAVNNLSLGIPGGECFGLLGINGAGKSTTMSMLTTECPPTSGNVTLAGVDICEDMYEARRKIGFCPQFDAHLENLTGRELVEMFSCIKGTAQKYEKEMTEAKLAAVGLKPADWDRLSGHYSGGMKRRLSLACATIGLPRLCFFDEPTTGVDPVGRREIWMMISDMLTDESVPDEEKPAIMLTTHSMEECEV
jgi:ATP-binding cassette, subfamily A (ABC1), member 3